MEFENFKEIREQFCLKHPEVTEGKMMSSPAIHYNNKVFAFFSRQNKMVFKLGKGFPEEKHHAQLRAFSPFKSKKPLTGWYEADFEGIEIWKELTSISLMKIKVS
ncbi:MAG: hypothetical protein ABJN84_07700 [Flavobacteriaceae bacterium]